MFSDWKVLQLILNQIPEVMKNKALILSRHANDIDLMAASLCSIVSFMVRFSLIFIGCDCFIFFKFD